MNIQQFQYVLAVAEFRHFETAADHCFISQSTLSTMISRLEDELGIEIFDRRKKPVEVSREGEEIVEQIKVISTEIAQLNELVKEMKGNLEGQVKIGCIPTVSPYLLPLFLYRFSQKYPGLTIELKETSTNEIIRLLKSRELDIGIISNPVSEPELLEYPIYKEPLVLFDTAEKPKKNITVKKMHWDNFWLLEEGHCFSDQILEICGTHNANLISAPNIHFKAGSINSLLHFVKAYNGQTLLPYMAALKLSEEDRQYVTKFKNPAPSRTIGLLVHRHFIRKKLLNLLRQEIKKNACVVKGIKAVGDNIKK